MDDIFTYLIDMPLATKEMIVPCNDGYTIYINARLSYLEQQNAYRHAMTHIRNHDFESYDVQKIELKAHKETKDGKHR